MASQKVHAKGVELESASRDEIEYLIDQYIHNERNRAILKRRLLDGICYEPLAEEFDLSDRQVKNIVYKCEEKLFRRWYGSSLIYVWAEAGLLVPCFCFIFF